jgi:uroporphyrinogen decarboxylase
MAAYMGRADFDKDWERFLLTANLAPPNEMREIAPGIVCDEWGVHWNRTRDKDIGVVCNTQVTPENITDYAVPDPTLPERYTHLKRITENGGSDAYVVASIGFSLFERAWTLAGMENIFMAMLVDKPFVNQLLDKILAFNLAVIDAACAYPIDGMRFGDDWGGQNGLSMGDAQNDTFFVRQFNHLQTDSSSPRRNKNTLLHPDELQVVYPQPNAATRPG